MRVLVLQLRRDDAVADSEFDAFVRYGGLRADEVARVRVEQGGLPAIDLDDYDAILVGGSPFDLSTPEDVKSPEQRTIEGDFMRLFDRVVPRDKPFLGACSGNGLLGRYCGTTISTRYAEPVGGVDVTLTGPGRQDALLAGLPDRFRVLGGHKEACDEVPRGATLLASSDTCPVQMFRLGANVYATQFHPELDADGIALRIRAYRHHGYFAADQADALSAALSHERTPVAHEILRRFVRRYRSD